MSRQELLKEWITLLKNYIIFIQDFTYIELPKVNLQRINLAFFDGARTYKDVMFEFNEIKNSQYEGYLIIFDNYRQGS